MVRWLAGGWLAVSAVVAGLSLWSGLWSAAPRAVFGAPAKLPTAEAIEQGGWVRLTDAWFDCDAWNVGSGRVPIRHPVPGVSLYFNRESVCHGHNARVDGVLSGHGPTYVVQSLAPVDDPVFLGCLLAALALFVGVTPTMVLRAGRVPPRLPLHQLETQPWTRLHGSWWAERLVKVVAYATMAGLGCYGAHAAVVCASVILVDEPRAWETGAPRSPVQLDDRKGLYLAWMEGHDPAAVYISLPVGILLDDEFEGIPQVRITAGGTVATNVGLHFTRSRLLSVGEALVFSLAIAFPVTLALLVTIRHMVHWRRAARAGVIRLAWLRVLESERLTYLGIPTQRRVRVQSAQGARTRTLLLPHPREPVYRRSLANELEVLVASVDDESLLVAWDGYPFHLSVALPFDALVRG